jgi:hypothetical protein
LLTFSAVTPSRLSDLLNLDTDSGGATIKKLIRPEVYCLPFNKRGEKDKRQKFKTCFRFNLAEGISLAAKRKTIFSRRARVFMLAGKSPRK